MRSGRALGGLRRFPAAVEIALAFALTLVTMVVLLTLMNGLFAVAVLIAGALE